MSELREKVAGVLLRQVQRRIGFDAKDCKSLKEMGNAGNDYYDDADAAIAAMRDALLGDEAVEALLESVEDDSIFAMALSANKQAGRPIANEASIEMGRKWMQAALAAGDTD